MKMQFLAKGRKFHTDKKTCQITVAMETSSCDLMTSYQLFPDEVAESLTTFH